MRASTTHRPLAALWSIYDSTLANAELDDEVDKRYFDFLVNFSRSEFRGRPLLETFRSLLREQNIILREQDVILEAADSPQAQEVENQIADADRQGVLSGEDEDEWRRPTRRVSFTSLYDTTREVERQLEPRSASRASVSKLDIDRSALPILDESRIWTREQLESPIRSRWDVTEPTPNKRTKAHNTGLRGSNAKKSPESDFAPARNALFHENDLAESSLDESSPISSEADYQPDPSSPPLHAPDLLYRPTKTKLIRYADVFNENREAALLRRILGWWSKKALDLVKVLYYWEYRAVEVDRKAILGEALSAWRALHQKKAQEAKTERLFEHLSKRADFARDLYLVGRVLSHWLVTAAKRVEETHVARRHLLRIKYFNAWRDITVIQELKAQRLGVKRPFKLLVRKYAIVLESQAKALNTYHHNLTRIVFYRWFWALCYARAPQYRDRHLKKDALTCWSQRLITHDQQQRDAACSYQQRAMRKALSAWAQKTRIDLGGNHQADGFKRSHLVYDTFKKWLLQAKLTPLAKQINRMQDWRVAREFFTIWHLRARMCIKANTVDHLRLKQNAWTAWNDELRVKTLTSQTNDRLRSQALYQWVLAQRAVLLRRACDRRISKDAMQRLTFGFRNSRRQWNRQEAQVADRQQQALFRSTFECWKLQMNMQRERENMAVDFSAHRSQQKWFHGMRHISAHIRQMEAQAGHAVFYFLTTKAIRRWRLATAESQKRRRQDAYARMRRQVKINLARRLLWTWRSRLVCLQDLDRMAHNAQRTRLLGILSRKFNTWRSQTLFISQMNLRATEKKSTGLRALSLQSWSEKLQSTLRLEDQAVQLHGLRMSAVCSALIRRMSLRAFEIHRREANADAMRDRHWAKHVRNILRHWAERVAGEITSDDSPTARRARQLQPEDEVMQSQIHEDGPLEPHEAEEWTASEDDLDAGDRVLHLPSKTQPLAVQTVTPGYLSTPSKRVARARALANISTTPGTPSRTPFAARVRAEMLRTRETQTAPPKSRRDSAGRSNLGQHVSFSNEARQK